MSEDRFISFFRMTRASFGLLANVIQDDPIFYNDSHNPQIAPSIQLATTLYILGSYGSSTVRAAAQLGIGEGTAHLYLQRCMIALVHLSTRYIQWPEPGGEDFKNRRSEIEEQSKFPGCVGFLDGTDIILQYAPSFHGETYFNRKKHYGLNLQGICDSERRFSYISTGFPASVGDATVFCETEFFKTPNRYFSQPEEYIIADKAYRVTRRCITPYKEPLASRVAEGYQEFNQRLASARVKIEQAFGILKNRWRSLRGLPIYIRHRSDHARAVCWITVCVILHNFLYNYEDDRRWRAEAMRFEEQGLEEAIMDEIANIDEPLGLLAERQAGIDWRNRIREYFLAQL